MAFLIPEKGAVDRTLADIIPILKRGHSQAPTLGVARIDVNSNGVYVTATDRYVLAVSKIHGEVENYTTPITVYVPLSDLEVWKAAKTGLGHVKIEPEGLTVGRLELRHTDIDYPSLFILFKRVFKDAAEPVDDESAFDVGRVKHIKDVVCTGRVDGMWRFAATDRVFGIQPPRKEKWQGIADEVEQLVKENA